MSVFEALHQVIIGPLKILMEFVYGAFYNVLQSEGGAIIPLSLTVNFLLLPFYVRADDIQSEERRMQKKMAPVLAQIKQNFHGDERYMMQLAYYRVNHYRPFYALRSALPLFLQIPFFTAAYQTLSNFSGFNGCSFGLIRDLGKPDGLLTVGSLSINLLPITMTAINILSCEVYARDLALKDRLRMYALALIFLVLLYKSPAGLVFYWTLNNLFSLVKNIVRKSRTPSRIRNILLAGLEALIIIFTVFLLLGEAREKPILLIASACAQILIIRTLLRKQPSKTEKSELTVHPNTGLFFCGGLLMAVLTGLMIPASVVSESPSEFILFSDYPSPLLYVFQAFLMALGCFVVWFGLVYFLCSPKARGTLTVVIWVQCGCSLLNFMLFGTDLGMLSPQLQFEHTPLFSTSALLINAGALLAVMVVVAILAVKQQKILRMLAPVLVLAVIVVSARDIWSIRSELPQIREAMAADSARDHHFKLSRNGKNVIVVMMDSAISSFTPYLFQESPELLEQFDGFTWYPNTLCYGPATNTAVPAVFGGYEYVPEEMNRRTELPLAKKQNEALRLMPTLFSEAGYQVTVCNPTYANYSNVADVSIFDDLPNVNAFNLTTSKLQNVLSEPKELQLRAWSRNFFCYGIMKISPLVFQSALYQEGNYYSPDWQEEAQYRFQTVRDMSQATGVSQKFIRSYGALCDYSDLTLIEDTTQNSFLITTNDTAHDLILLQEPDYTPALSVDNLEYDRTHTDRFTWNGQTLRVTDNRQMMAYQINMAALKGLGEWFDFLREQGVYDNTRIIIVADHGRTLNCFESLSLGSEDYEDIMRFNPLLFVKDFDAHGFSRDDSFMTNADTPLLAFSGLINNPVNPATGKPLSDQAKYADEQHVFYTVDWQVNKNNGNTYLSGLWLALKNQNVLDRDNWSQR